MRSFIVALVAAAFMAAAGFLPAKAEWANKNAQINQTNFIIMDEGRPICSATLVSIKFKLVLTANHCMGDFISSKEVEETRPDGEVKKVTKETLDPVPLSQKIYQGYDQVGSNNYLADIVGYDKKVDIAILKIRGDSIPQTMASKILPEGQKVQRGDRVWVVGNPLGMLDATLTSGVVSSTTRKYKTPWADEEEVAFIQTDAAINGGNSGGSMYNDDGVLIGIPDAGWRGANGLGLTLTPESIRAFLKRHCYAEIYDEKQTRHDCVQEKRKIENLKRDKVGLPPLKDDEGPQE